MSQSIFLGSTHATTILEKIMQNIASDKSKLDQMLYNPTVPEKLTKKGNWVSIQRSLEK